MTSNEASVESARARLSEASPRDFTSLRDDLARALRAAGDKTGAAEVARARKPSTPLWTLNALAREAPTESRELAALSTKPLPEAQKRLGSLVRELRQKATSLIEGARLTANVSTLRSIEASLRAIPLASLETRERWLAGRLEAELGATDELTPSVVPPASPAKQSPDESSAAHETKRAHDVKRAEEAKRAAAAAEQERLAALERERLATVARELERARARVAKLEAAATELEAKAQAARERADALELEARQARLETERAARDLEARG